MSYSTSSSHSHLTYLPAVAYLASRYRDVLEAVYSRQIPQGQKYLQALDEDKWRYDQLPQLIAKRLKGEWKDGGTKKGGKKKGMKGGEGEEEPDNDVGESEGMTLDELSRLVKWKM